MTSRSEYLQTLTLQQLRQRVDTVMRTGRQRPGDRVDMAFRLLYEDMQELLRVQAELTYRELDRLEGTTDAAH